MRRACFTPCLLGRDDRGPVYHVLVCPRSSPLAAHGPLVHHGARHTVGRNRLVGQPIERVVTEVPIERRGGTER